MRDSDASAETLESVVADAEGTALIDAYLAEVGAIASLRGPGEAKARRREVRAYVETALVEAGSRDDATVRWVIQSLGSPADVARRGAPWNTMPLVGLWAGPSALDRLGIGLAVTFGAGLVVVPGIVAWHVWRSRAYSRRLTWFIAILAVLSTSLVLSSILFWIPD